MVIKASQSDIAYLPLVVVEKIASFLAGNHPKKMLFGQKWFVLLPQAWLRLQQGRLNRADISSARIGQREAYVL